jgi:cyclohexanone monooxygenase
MRSLHGIHVHGFPNAFVVGPTQGANLISNIPHNLIEAGATVATIIGHALDLGAVEVEVTEEAEQAWIDRLLANFRGFGGNPDCTPGYYNNEGQAAGRRGELNSAGFPEGPVAYFEYIAAWRSSGDFEGLDLRPGRTGVRLAQHLGEAESGAGGGRGVAHVVARAGVGDGGVDHLGR